MGSLQIKNFQNIVNTDVFIGCFKTKPEDQIITGHNNTDNTIFVKNITTNELYEIKLSVMQQGNTIPKEKIDSIIWDIHTF